MSLKWNSINNPFFHSFVLYLVLIIQCSSAKRTIGEFNKYWRGVLKHPALFSTGFTVFA
jgi:hypothetical protein